MNHLNIQPVDNQYPRPALWPKQTELFLASKKELETQGWSLLKLGQRSGKSIIVAEVAREYEVAFLFDTADSIAGTFPIPYAFCGVTIPAELVDGIAQKSLVVINEFAWIQDSFALFCKLRELGYKVLVIGSNGPEFEKDERWHAVEGHSYAAWEVNPNLSKEEIVAEGDDLAQRDFGSF